MFYCCDVEQNPEGILKMRKLRKLVLKALRESGFTEDESQLTDALEQKVKPICWTRFLVTFLLKIMRFSHSVDEFLCVMQINSSSKFTVDGKYVRLASKS